MSAPLDVLNRARYRAGQQAGHYESFYQRGNHPELPLAFWIRYTVLHPKGRPEAAIGELWAVFFDGVTGEHVVVKEEYPLSECDFDTTRFAARVGKATLDSRGLKGECASFGSSISWDLSYSGDAQPVYLIPRKMYDGAIPKAKSLVGLPSALYSGQLMVNGRTVDVDGWTGSQNHNWGSQHTDHYAFGQVAGFDNAPDSFLEIVTAQAKLGPVTLPYLTFLVLRHRGREYSLVSLRRAWKAKADFGYFHWRFSSADDDVRITGRISAEPADFVGLNYYNPPGGIKHCLNTKIGACELTVTDRATGETETLTARDRALFEILTDDREHGIAIRA